MKSKKAKAATKRGVVSAPGCSASWLPIETAPKTEEIVDIWSPSHGRMANYYRNDYNGDGKNVFYDPVESGICTIRDATHWMPLPNPPNPAVEGRREPTTYHNKG